MSVLPSAPEAMPAPSGRSVPVAFVVLHYLSASLTAACVDSVLGLDDPSGRLRPVVVVVDNASHNGSLEELEGRYAGMHSVAFVRNERNEGFSVANNRAYRHALNRFSPRHVVVLNNDVTIEQPDFLGVLEDVQARGRAHVIGPDVFVRRKGFHQSPLRTSPYSRQRALESLDLNREVLAGHLTWQTARPLLRRTLLGLPVACRMVAWRNMLRKRRFAGWRMRQEHVVPHGAALVFTDRFVRTGQLPFEPATFLYLEEDILALRCERAGWKVVYEPALQVIHYDDGSTELLTQQARAKDTFMREARVDSLRIYLSFLDEGGSHAAGR